MSDPNLLLAAQNKPLLSRKIIQGLLKVLKYIKIKSTDPDDNVYAHNDIHFSAPIYHTYRVLRPVRWQSEKMGEA